MKQRQYLKWVSLIGLLLISLFTFAPSVSALEGRTDEEVIIKAGEIIEDDLYVGANHFVLDGTVKGDLVVGGTLIEINGTVEGDLLAAGQTLLINGTIQDDVRFAGAVARLGESAHIERDLLFAGYSLETLPGSMVGNDVFFTGAQAKLAGSIADDATLYAAGLALYGDIGGDVVAEVGSADELPAVSPFTMVPDAPTIPTVVGGLTLGDDASIGGNFDYITRTSIQIPAGVVAGRISEEIAAVEVGNVVDETAVFSGAWFLKHLRRLIALFLVGLLLVWLMPTQITRISEPIQAKPFASLGWGLVAFIMVMVAFLLILALTIILAAIFGGVTLGNLVGVIVTVGLLVLFALAVLFGLVIAYGSTVLVSLIGGHLILDRLNPNWAASRVTALALGLLIFVILTAVPYIGGWINFAVVLLGFGALWMFGQAALQQRQSKTAPPTAGKPTIQPTGA